MRLARLITVGLAICLLLNGNTRADSAPEWVQAVLQASPQSFDKGEPFIVLLDERITTVKSDGRAETRSRYVLRVLTEEGRAAARREIQYDSQTRISDLQAWHIRADDKVFKLGSRNAIEESITDDLYSEIRSKVMRFQAVDIGSVVAFEWVQKEKPLVNQDYHFFQTRSPVVASRYQLNLPEGWRVESRVFNHAPVTPVVDGNSYTWEVRDLPSLKEETDMPDLTGLLPYLAVAYYPPGGPAASGNISSWQDVSRWTEQLIDDRNSPNEAIISKARELTTGLESDFDKAQAISRWVQKNIRYVSIQLGVIGGYRPNPASVVFKKGYGDCKDKAALLQAMLGSAGIKSYMVLVYSGDPTRVRPEFPSPLQFNHAIVAIALNRDTQSMLDSSGLGRLLLFDPTDSVTPLGDLPFYLQGGYGLVVNGDSGDLFRLPVSSESANSVRRELNAQIQDTGEVTVEVKETATGQMASLARRRISMSNADQYAKEMSSRVARDIPGATLSDLKINRDADPGDPLTLQYTVRADHYGNRLGRLFVLRPILLWVQDHPTFTKPDREYPVLFDMKSTREDMIEIALPHGFKIDELPPDVDLKEGFGQFKLEYKVSGDQVVVHRWLAITRQLAPASDYGDIKKFFDAAQAASQSSLVLAGR